MHLDKRELHCGSAAMLVGSLELTSIYCVVLCCAVPAVLEGCEHSKLCDSRYCYYRGNCYVLYVCGCVVQCIGGGGAR